MKKFLSLLLALTMVLSLVVVPARAHDGEVTVSDLNIDASDVERGTQKSFTLAGTPTVSDNRVNATEARITSYSWTVPNFTGNPGTAARTATLTAATPTTGNNKVKVSCTVSIEYTLPAAEEHGTPTTKTVTETVESGEFSITNKLLPTDITKVTFNGREYSVTDGSVNIVLLGSESLANGPWTAIATNGYTIDNGASSANKPSYTEGTGLTVKTTDATPLSTTITVTHTDATVSATATPNTVLSEGTTTLTATSNLSSEATYRWFTKSGTTETPITNGTVKSFSWKVPKVDSDTTYQVICKAYEKGQTEPSATSSEITVTVKKNDYTISAAVSSAYATAYNNSIVLPSVGNTATVTITFQDKDKREVTSSVTYGYDITGNTNAFSASNRNQKAMTVTMVSNGSISVTPYVIFMGKKISATPITITGNALTATLSSVQSGGYRDYAYSELVNAAQAAITTRSTTSYGYNYSEIVSSVSVRSQTVTNYGTFTAPSVVNDYYRFTSYGNVIGTAAVTGTVTTNRGTYSITFNIPVSPTKVAYEDQYPEPVAYGNTYRYYVQVPSGYSSYYVLGTPNQATEPNWTLTGTQYYGNNLQYYGNNLYYLTDSNFVGGKCTLWLVTKDSSNRYSCGQLTVYQKNYNINYNGVAGETVQFKHADFTNFMNEVSQARGDASKTGSYPYVTFNYVTFNYPTSTQGTLYYNGTAMSNSSYSGSFNSRTQITNLDNVTFVPYARTSAKSIPLTFTLSVTKYGANGAVVNRDLKYTGTVAVSIVREDIKYTAAPGDTIRFTDSDFLNYLRTQNGFNSNYYSIDYVTFDQSAVNALNEGVLYAYSTGFNAVKTTDKFYYTTTSYNQNALSDVTFRASAYAKTGTTVYIPFTIYARYGTTGTGTRQVSGTVAIKLAQTMNFVDVKPTDYFYDSVKWAVNSNITKGTSATTFSPYKTCTRAEIVTFLWRAAGSKTPTITRNPFTDVAPSMGMDYYYAILWASQNGIAAGTSATTFSPNATCTRAQIVTFLWRYSNKPAGYYSNPFTDVNKAEHAAYYDAILWAVGKGITKGTTATTFSPYGTCTRGEAVTFLYRAVNGK